MIFIRKIVKWLYLKYVDEVHLPKDVNVRIYRNALVDKEKMGRISSIVLYSKPRGKYNSKEYCIFPQYHKIWEDDCGIDYWGDLLNKENYEEMKIAFNHLNVPLREFFVPILKREVDKEYEKIIANPTPRFHSKIKKK